MALVQFAASAANTAGVFFGHGPSSKVSTISPSRRKSWDLKCSKPNPGPPVVSISTTREIPIASGLPGQDVATRGAAAGAGAGAGLPGLSGGRRHSGPDDLRGCHVGVFSATMVDGELSVASGGERRLRRARVSWGSALAPPGSLSLSGPAPLWTPPVQAKVKPSERKIAGKQLRQSPPQTKRSQARTLPLQAAWPISPHAGRTPFGRSEPQFGRLRLT